jgi:predicted HicB family RNase H-like nuclease
MATAVEDEAMARKKSETRRHTGMMRVDATVLARAKLAASMTGMALADYVSDVLRKASDRDIEREAKRLAKGTGEPKGVN